MKLNEKYMLSLYDDYSLIEKTHNEFAGTANYCIVAPDVQPHRFGYSEIILGESQARRLYELLRQEFEK